FGGGPNDRRLRWPTQSGYEKRALTLRWYPRDRIEKQRNAFRTDARHCLDYRFRVACLQQQSLQFGKSWLRFLSQSLKSRDRACVLNPNISDGEVVQSLMAIEPKAHPRE